jgi:hypothetical protein
MNHQLSSLRSQLRQVQQLLPSLLEACLAREPILPGSLYLLRRKCGKPSCHCARGELHESTVLAYRGQGRPRNISPAPEQLETLKNLTDHYRRCRTARAQLVRWQRRLLELVDDLLDARVRLGQAQFQKLQPPAAAPHRQPRSPRK